MNNRDILDAIKASFKRNVPNGFIGFNAMMGGGRSVHIGMIDNHLDCSGHIRQNDQGYNIFFIHQNMDPLKESTNLVIEFDGCTIATVPTDRYHAMGRHKIGTRKISGDTKKALLALDKFFKRYADAIKEVGAASNIYAQDRLPEKYYKF